MNWKYEQSTGKLFFDGKVIATDYSGKGKYKNNSEIQHKKSLGPIPRGEYTINRPIKSSKTGSYVLPLTPVSHIAWGGLTFKFMVTL